jgi:hypothetical protein
MSGPLALDVIPKIRDYCDLFNITNLSERERLVRHVVTLDNVYLAYMAERRKQQQQQQAQ